MSNLATGDRMETEEMGRGFQRGVETPWIGKMRVPRLALPDIPADLGFSLLLIDGGVGEGRRGRSRPGGSHPHRPEDKRCCWLTSGEATPSFPLAFLTLGVNGFADTALYLQLEV